MKHLTQEFIGAHEPCDSPVAIKQILHLVIQEVCISNSEAVTRWAGLSTANIQDIWTWDAENQVLVTKLKKRSHLSVEIYTYASSV